jgi:hypothetical protein
LASNLILVPHWLLICDMSLSPLALHLRSSDRPFAVLKQYKYRLVTQSYSNTKLLQSLFLVLCLSCMNSVYMSRR